MTPSSKTAPVRPPAITTTLLWRVSWLAADVTESHVTLPWHLSITPSLHHVIKSTCQTTYHHHWTIITCVITCCADVTESRVTLPWHQSRVTTGHESQIAMTQVESHVIMTSITVTEFTMTRCNTVKRFWYNVWKCSNNNHICITAMPYKICNADHFELVYYIWISL